MHIDVNETTETKGTEEISQDQVQVRAEF